MIYFSPTVRALRDQIADLKERLNASEAKNQALLDRLLVRNRIEPVTEAPKVAAPAAPAVIAPPWTGFAEIQDAQKTVWIEEEANFLMDNAGYDPARARNEAERRHDEQFAISLI